MNGPAIPSPIDAVPTPDSLTAKVVRPGAHPLLHGYDVERDLARHYGEAELLLLTLTGQLPDEASARAFEIALAFAAPIGVNEAPSHAAMLSRLCGTPPSRVMAVAALALSEQARSVVENHAALLRWLDGHASHPPTESLPRDAADRDAAQALRDAMDVRRARRVAALRYDLGRWPAIIVVLHACGLTQGWQVGAALVTARLSVAVAEAMRAEGGMRSYPMHAPRFQYTHVRSSDG